MRPDILQALEASASDLSETSPNFKGLIYGKGGAGKTVWAMKLAQRITPPNKRIVYLDTAENWVSSVNHPGTRDRTRRYQFQGITQIDAIAQAMDERVDPWDKTGCIIIDEHTTVNWMDVINVTSARASLPEGRNENKNPDEPTWPDRNISLNRMRKNLLSITRQPVHLILVGHEAIEKGSFKPDYSLSVAPRMEDQLHFVGRLTADPVGTDQVNYTRRIQSHPSSKAHAKSRIGGLPFIDDADKVADRIVEWLNTGAAPVAEQPIIVLNEPGMMMEEEDDE